MYRKWLCVGFILTACLNSSCGLLKGKEVVSQKDANGSIDEKIAYHRKEIKTYQEAIEKEKKHSVDSLQSRNMSEVRRTNDKISMYEKKIQENEQAIIKLNEQKKSMNIT